MKDDQNKKPLMWVDISPTAEQLMYSSVYKVFLSKQTKFQEMWIVECGDYGKSLFLDGESQSATNNEFYYHEALVHPACILHGNPQKVLILGGGEGATIREVLKWKTIKSALMVDIDADVVDACKQYLPEMHQGAFDDPRVQVIIQDAIDFLEKTETKWDVIISDLTSPTEDGNSYKLFTVQYIELCKRLLNTHGVFVIQAGPVVPVNMKSHIKLAATVKYVFPYFISYATLEGWGFILGSNTPIKTYQDSIELDQILLERTTNKFSAIDGIAINGMLHTPKYIRDAVSSEKQIYK